MHVEVLLAEYWLKFHYCFPPCLPWNLKTTHVLKWCTLSHIITHNHGSVEKNTLKMERKLNVAGTREEGWFSWWPTVPPPWSSGLEELGKSSANAQGLRRPVTSGDRRPQWWQGVHRCPWYTCILGACQSMNFYEKRTSLTFTIHSNSV